MTDLMSINLFIFYLVAYSCTQKHIEQKRAENIACM